MNLYKINKMQYNKYINGDMRVNACLENMFKILVKNVIHKVIHGFLYEMSA